MGKKELAKLALEIVGIGGTAGSAYMSQKGMDISWAVSMGGATASAGAMRLDAAILTKQFEEATAYVSAQGKNATLGGLQNHLEYKNASVKTALLKGAFKMGINSPDLMDSSNSLKTSTFQCVADVAELSFDASLAVAQGATGIGLLAATVTGVGMVAQLYATGVSCGNAAVQGIHAVSEMSAQAIKEMAAVRNRMMTAVNKFIEEGSAELVAEFSPSRNDYSRMPKPARDELQLGLLVSLQLGEQLPPMQFLKFLMVEKISKPDADHIGKAVVLMYKLQYDKTATTFSPKDQADVKRVSAEYLGLNLGTAYKKFFENSGFQSTVSRVSN